MGSPKQLPAPPRHFRITLRELAKTGPGPGFWIEQTVEPIADNAPTPSHEPGVSVIDTRFSKTPRIWGYEEFGLLFGKPITAADHPHDQEEEG